MPHNNAHHSTYLADRLGHARITPDGPFVAGEQLALTLTYTAGYFGIDDTGSLKVVHRFASDAGRLQFNAPQAPNYVTAEASNGAELELRYDNKGNLRPWDKTLVIRIARGFLREGDRIVVRLGDTRFGSPGLRMQTFAEGSFEYKVLVDAFATYNYVELPEQPNFAVVAGPPVLYRAVLPTMRRAGDRFSLGFKGEDRWGNPSDRTSGRFHLQATLPVAGLPEFIDIQAGQFATRVDNLTVLTPGELRIHVHNDEGHIVCSSNPLRIVGKAALLPYWTDLHGQSEETIGTNSARELIEFARDRAFLDGMSHQGNDFQITAAFWRELNQLTAEYDEAGRFVIFPGYEWSGNTGLGGDRNVLFRHEGRPLHRSHHALVSELGDVDSDAHSAEALFTALSDEDCVVFAHVGGRYADICAAHDARLERSVEIHSDWGTFEWLLDDAFKQGYRVGIVANSDGHKGRHGASHPGASLFGAYGGLTCLLAPSLDRDGLFDALRRRHHYATTGCRAHLDVRARFDRPAGRFDDDPALGGRVVEEVREALMGDILHSADGEVELIVDIAAGAPIERVEIRNREQIVETWRPYTAEQLGARVRIVWEGSEYRGRGRQTAWDGSAIVRGNSISAVRAINLWNIDKPLCQPAPDTITWAALTTGGFGGAEIVLAEPRKGALHIETPLVRAQLPIADIGLIDHVFDTGGGIQRRLRVFRLPDRNPCQSTRLQRRIRRAVAGEDALYVCVTLEDGHRLWSSPIYLLRDAQDPVENK